MRMVWKTLRVRHVGLAFFWACSMLTFRSSILLAGQAGKPELETLVVVISFVANATALFAMAAFIEKDPAAFDRLPGWLFAALIVAGLVLLAASGYAGQGALVPLLVAGSVLTGIGYGYFWGSWAEVYGRMHPSRTSFYLPVAYLLTAALFLAISLAAEAFAVPGLVLVLMVPLPLLSLWCLRRCKAETADDAAGDAAGRGGHGAAPRRYAAALASLGSLLLATIVLSCLFGFSWELTVFTVGSVNEAHRIPLIANLGAGVALIGLVVFARRRIDLTLAYRVIVPVIIVLFAVLPFFWETNPIVLNAVMSASYGVFDVIIWYLCVSTAYDFSVSGFVVGGIVRAVSILLRLLGIGIGYLIMLVPGQHPAIVLAVSLGALYVLAMLALFHHTRGRKGKPAPDRNAEDAVLPGSAASNSTAGNASSLNSADVAGRPLPHNAGNDSGGNAPRAAEHPSALPDRGSPSASQPAPEPAPPADPDAVYALIAEDYGLTRREAEVLPYLARGRSAKIIADALFVSESTIRTHTRRILEKTDLHSKQQLIDLIERYG